MLALLAEIVNVNDRPTLWLALRPVGGRGGEWGVILMARFLRCVIQQTLIVVDVYE